MSFKNIAIDTRYKKVLRSTAGEAGIYPGFLLEPSSDEFIAHTESGGDACFVADMLMEDSIADAFSSGDYLPILAIEPGDSWNAFLATNQEVSEGDKISSNGDGYVKKFDDGEDEIGGDTNYLTLKPASKDLVHVELVDPSGNDQSLAVTIEGNYVKVSLATGGSGDITSTPSEIETAIKAVSGYDNLLSVEDTDGTGAVEADEVFLKADAKAIGFAEEDVTTTSSAARLRVRKGA